MDKVGSFNFITESYLLDFRGRVTIPMIGNYMLHAASCHAADHGFGFSDMTEKNTAWVLSRLAIEMRSFPTMDQPITVSTWVEGVYRLFTERCFDVKDAKGNPIGYARSIWAAIDMETRRPTILDVEGLKPYMVERPCPIERPAKISQVEELDEGEPYTVRYSDLDINGHLNSIKYMEHLLNMFDIEMYKTKEISRFEIAYLSEGRYGMNLMLHNHEIQPGLYHMAICNEGKAIARASATWK